jgi:diguanylate cyclase
MVQPAASSGVSFFRALAAFAERQATPPAIKVAAAISILLLLAIATAVVHQTGGTRYASVHFAYVPVIAAAYFFGLRGGLLAAIAAGLVLGPLMPLDVEAGTSQGTLNWLTRIGFFVLIGALSGLASDTLGRQLQTIRRQGLHDQLTGLPNRTQLLNALEEAIVEAQRQNSALILLSMALTDFEKAQSTFGSDYSDRLHIAAARRLEGLLPHGSQAFSIGGGMFAVPFYMPAEEIIPLGLRIAEAFDQRFDVDGIPILCSGHAGLAQFSTDGADAMSLLRASLSALREAEAANEHLRAYDGQLDRARHSKHRLLPDLQMALTSGNQITLHYQPVLDLSSGQCRRAEALVRWQHPTLGAIAPGDFIPAAERTALMRPLTDLVLDLAVAQLKRWQQEGINLQLSVNISVRDLEDTRFVESVRSLLSLHEVPASALELEVTEGALMTCPQTIVTNLEELRRLGISIALDDFGTGQSSLSYLAKLPADTLKLDRTFANDMKRSSRTAVAVRAVIDAAHNLGQKVVAEGLEDRDVVKMFRELSCDFGQGYVFSRPVSEADLRAWLLNHDIARLRAFNTSPFVGLDQKRARRT